MATINTVKQYLSFIMREERAQGMVEYSLVIALLVLVVIVTLKSFSASVVEMYEQDIQPIINEVVHIVT